MIATVDSYLGSSYPNVFEEELQASLAGDPPTRLLIDDFPPDTQAFVLKEYIQSLCPIGVECTVSVHETVALAKFKSAIGKFLMIQYCYRNIYVYRCQ